MKTLVLLYIVRLFSAISSSNGFTTVHRTFSSPAAGGGGVGAVRPSTSSTTTTTTATTTPSKVSSFATPASTFTFTGTSTSRSSTSLYSSSSFTNPTQEESVNLGIREWPQQTKSQSTWEEEVKDGETLIRYILQGSGDLIIDGNRNRPNKFNTGLLIEVNGPASLNWVKKSSDDVIILTPGYEQGGLLAGAAFTLIALCGALIAGVGS